MNLYDFGSDCAETYIEKCECGEEIQVSTQKDNSPEYYTDIFVKCHKCGESVSFYLPVN